MGFEQMTHDWANFFGALAQISGALVGLVFVALTFNARLLGTEGDPLLGALARQIFADFLLLLIISMLMLTPHVVAFQVGLFFLLLSGMGLLRIVGNLLRSHRQLLGRASGWLIPQRFLLSAAGQVMLGWAGREMMRTPLDQGLVGSLLFTGVAMLMLSGCRSAWLLVSHREK